MTIRIQTLRAPARTLSELEAKQLRRRILELNLRLSNAPAFRDNWAARIDHFLDTTDVLELAWDDDELVGHLGERRLRLRRFAAVYIDSFTVAPERQTGGLGRILAGAYDGPFVEVPSTRHRRVARYFDAHVDAARGDAVVQIVRYTPATWLRLAAYFVRHRLRRRSTHEKQASSARGAA